MKKKLIIIGITLILISIGLSGCTKQPTDYILIDYELHEGWNGLGTKIVSWCITGTITNTHTKMADYVQITGEFYDENNVLLYHDTISLENIISGETVEFGETTTLFQTNPYICFELTDGGFTFDTFPQNVNAKCYVNYVEFYN